MSEKPEWSSGEQHLWEDEQPQTDATFYRIGPRIPWPPMGQEIPTQRGPDTER
jgi:hypothetical protein